MYYVQLRNILVGGTTTVAFWEYCVCASYIFFCACTFKNLVRNAMPVTTCVFVKIIPNCITILFMIILRNLLLLEVDIYSTFFN